jgi:iron complex outermembrane recepter protein
MKMRLQSLAIGSALGCVAMALAVPAMAQESKTAGGELAEVVVTANKRVENINKVGLTITAMSGDKLSEQRITSLEDVASAVPGLTFTPSTTNTPIFTLRGVGFNESSLGVYPAVSVYIDQVPLSFPVLASHSAYDLERVEVLKGPQGTLFGQNSTGGAINYIAAKPTTEWTAGGDISFGRFSQIDGNGYVSGPITDTLGMRVAVTGLTMGDWQRSYTRDDSNGHKNYVAGRLLLAWKPTDSTSVDFNFNAWQDTSQPQAQQLIAIHEQVSATGPAPVNAAPINDALRNYISPILRGTLSEQLGYPFAPNDARAADWSNENLDPDTGTPNGGGAIPIGSATSTLFRPFSNRKFWQAAVRVDKGLGPVTLTSLTSYIDFNQSQRTDGDGAAFVAYDLQSGKGSIKSFNQELRLANSDANSRVRWIVGGNFEHSLTAEDQYLRYFANSNYYPANLFINSSGEILNQGIRNYAGFGNIEFDVSPTITLKAGARYTNSRINVYNCGYTGTNGNVDKLFNILGGISTLPFTPIGPSDCYTLNSTPPAGFVPPSVTINSPTASGGPAGLGIPGIPLDATLKQSNVSWRVGADFKVKDDLLIYANVSKGFKAGSFPAVAAAAYISALPVTQESVTAFEAGFKAQLNDSRVQWNGAAFYYDYKDKQIRGKLFDFIFGTLDTLVNVPKSSIIGLESDVTFRPTNSVTLMFAGTYLKSKIKEYVGYDIFGGIDLPTFAPNQSNTQDLSGNVIPYTPKFSAVFDGDYRTNRGGATPFFGITAQYKSKQDAAIGGSNSTLPVGPRYRLAPGVVNPYTIDAYTTVDLRAGYEAEGGKFRVMVWGKNIFNKYYWTAVIPSSDSSARLAGMPATYGISFAQKFK